MYMSLIGGSAMSGSNVPDYFWSMFHPERVKLYERAAKLLDDLGQEQHHGLIQEHYTAFGDLTTFEMFSGAIHGVYQNHTLYALDEFGVKLLADTPLYIILDVLCGLMQMEYYINPEEILNTISEEESPEETVSNLIPMFCSSNQDEIFMSIESVRESTLTRIVMMMEDKVAVEPSAIENIDTRLSQKEIKWRRRAINMMMTSTDFISPEYVRNISMTGSKIGLPLSYYISNYVDMDVFDTLAPEVQVFELAALLLYSCDGKPKHMFESIKDVVKQELPDIKLKSAGEAQLLDFVDMLPIYES